MAKKLIQIRKDYYDCLDGKARKLAGKLSNNKKVTELLMDYISELYDSASTEKKFSKEGRDYEHGYQSSVTPDIEFLVARTLHHFSVNEGLGWCISLRKQKEDKNTGKKVTPDIKIARNGRIIAIVEIKAKAGWMQPFFSDKRKLADKKAGNNPEKEIRDIRKQLMKYARFEDCGKDNLFVFLPTFIHVNRKKYDNTAEDYRETFAKNSGLKKGNLILLSGNTGLDLAERNERKDYLPTTDFENFVNKIKKR